MSSIEEVAKDEFIHSKSKGEINQSMSFLDKSNIMNLKIIEQFEQANGLNDANWRNYVENTITEDNVWIFIYFTMKFNEKYLKYISEEILDRLNLNLMEIGEMSEDVFESKYQPYILLNALSQSINLIYKDFLHYTIEHENKLPTAIVLRLLENEEIEFVKEMIEKKIAIYDIETSNLFEQSKFAQSFFQKLDNLPESTKIKEKNNFLTPKHVIYYLHKSEIITKAKRDNIIKELMTSMNLVKSEILGAIIKMKDQELAEELITSGDELMFDEENLTQAMLTALKFNQPRVAHLLYQYVKSHMTILKDRKLHRALIRTLIEYPENIEIYLYIVKRLVSFFNVSDIIYLLSSLDQLTFHKSSDDCKFLRAVNPLKIFVLILEVIEVVRLATYQVKTKCDSIFVKYMQICTTFISEASDKRSLEAIFKDKDLENRELIYIVAVNNFQYILKNPTVEHIVAKTWNSTFSAQNNFYETSTLFQIVKSDSVDQIKTHLSKVASRSPMDYRNFTEGFLIWKESMKVKYYNQIFLFVFFLLFFQILNNLFVGSLSPKLENAINLRQTVKIWLPAFNAYFNGTNFTLSQINEYVTTKNMTFIGTYIMKMSPILSQNLTLIGNWTAEMLSGLDDIKSNVVLLNYSTYIYLYAILHLFFRFVYQKKTNSKIKIFDTQSLFDIIILFIILFRICYIDAKFMYLFDFKNIDKYDDSIRKAYVIVMSGFFVCLWLKTIIYFKFSDKIGPLLRISEMIIESLMHFGIIFFSEFFIFGCIGNLLFALDRVNQDYKQITTSFLATFRATMNDFNYKDFHEDNINIAAMFLTIHLIVSGIILLNFLIAILSNTYEKFQESSVLLFHQEIILKKAELMPDKDFGALILIPFPFNFINLFFLPFYLCCSSRKKLRKMNRIGMFIAYSPLAFIYFFMHTVTQLVLFPVVIFKLLFYTFFEVCNSSQAIGQRRQTTNDRIFKSLYCGLMFLLSPLLFIYCLIFDGVTYLRCLYRDEEGEQLYLEQEELITPFILQKVSEIFDKTKEPNILCEEVIDDFSVQMKLTNEKYDFKNVLIGVNHKESMNMVREYSVFVKFMDKIRLKNPFNERILSKSLIARLIDSNINFCRIVESQKSRSRRINSNKSLSKIFPDDLEKSPATSFSQTQIMDDNNNDDDSDEEINNILEMQMEMSKNDSKSRRNIVTFSKLPKLFYQRLYMINLQDLLNTLELVERSDNQVHVIQKIRSDLKTVKKQFNKLSVALNTRELFDKQRKSRVSMLLQRKNTMMNGANAVFSKPTFNKFLKINPDETPKTAANPESDRNRKKSSNAKASVFERIDENHTEEGDNEKSLMSRKWQRD